MDNEWEHWLLEQHDPTWEKNHKSDTKILSASIFPDIVGFGYRSRMMRWELMTGKRKSTDESNANYHMIRGQIFEFGAIKRFYNQHPEYLPVGQPGSKKSSEYPWIQASPDHVWIHGDTKEIGLLEVKCPADLPREPSLDHSSLHIYNWKHHNDLLVKNENIKCKYLIQMQIQMYCMGPSIKNSILYLYTVHSQYTIKVPRDDEMIQCLLELGFIFYGQVQKNEPPSGACYKDHTLCKRLIELYNSLVFL